MSTLYGAHTQALGFSYSGQKPTFPESGLTPSSHEWKSTDIMPREWAYNSADDIWYYNTGTEIKAFSGNSTEETISVETTAYYDAEKEEDSGGYAYYAGSDFVVYSNINSSNEDFREEQIYLCIESALTGESPETNPEKWEAQGDTVTVATSGASTLFYDSTSDIQTIIGYVNGNNAVDISTGKIYEYQTTATTGLQPNDNSETTGRWVEIGTLSSGGHTILDTDGNELATQTKLKFTGGLTAENDDVNGQTVVKPDIDVLEKVCFYETLVFRDIEVFEFTKSQSFKITQVISESGVTASIKIHGTETDYVINDTVAAFNRLDITVDVLGVITIKGILV